MAPIWEPLDKTVFEACCWVVVIRSMFASHKPNLKHVKTASSIYVYNMHMSISAAA